MYQNKKSYKVFTFITLDCDVGSLGFEPRAR